MKNAPTANNDESAPDKRDSTPGTFPKRRNTVTAGVLAALMESKTITGMDGVFSMSSTRLAAFIFYLEQNYGWTIERRDFATGTNDGRESWVTQYWLLQATITQAFDRAPAIGLMASMQPGPNVASWPPSAKSKPPRRTPCAPNSASRTRAKLDFGATSNARRHPQQHRAGAALHSTAGAGLADARAAGVRVRARLCMSDSLFLRIKSLNIRTMRGVSSSKSVVRVAAAHNLRELAAELGVNATSGIDPSRIGLNYQLRGPDTATGVADLAQALLDNAGVTNLRKDAAMALELVFGLPPASVIDHREFFTAAVSWADAFFNAPILSAAVHLDESAPHCHVLVLPLVSGRMNGGALAGGPSKIKMMLVDFQQQVGKRFGLMHQPRAKRLSKANRDAAGRQVLDALKAHPERLNQSAVRDALIAALGQHHETLMPLLGLELQIPKPKGKSFVEIMCAPAPEKKARQTSIDIPRPISIDVGGNEAVGVEDCPSMYMHCKTSDFQRPDFPPFPEQPSATITPTTSQPSDEKHAASLPKAGAQRSAAQRSTSDITSATGQIRNTSSAQVQTVSLAQPLKPAVGIAPTSSMPPDQRQPADTLRKVAETPEPPTAGPAATVSDGPTKRARAAANRQPASTPAPGEHAEMGNLVLAQQPTSASTAPLTTMRAVQFLDTLTISQQPTSITSAPRESAENTSLAQMRELAGPATPAPATGIENPLHAPEARATTPATWPPYASAAINSTTTAATTSTAAPDAPQQVEHRQLRPRDERAMAVPQAGDSEHSATVLRPLVDEVQIPHPTGDHHQD